MSVEFRSFGKSLDGTEGRLFTMKNLKGMMVQVMNYGATIVSINVPDKYGKIEDVVLGYDSLYGYLDGDKYMGATIGRCCNRTEHGEFSINGVLYRLTKNEGENHLHGGNIGFDKVFWDSKIIDDKENAVEFYYMSKDMEEGYTGNLKVWVRYTLTEDNAIKIEYKALSDKDTVVNLTNHSYFNLSGDFRKKVLEHKLTIDSHSFTVNNKESISNGEIREVSKTPLDFRKLKVIGKDINFNYHQLLIGHGYNQNFILNSQNRELQKAAILMEENSGRIMDVYTDYPCIQVYTANFFDGTDIGKNGVNYTPYNSICLETQYAPNSINYKGLKSPLLKSDDVYSHTIIYKFSI